MRLNSPEGSGVVVSYYCPLEGGRVNPPLFYSGSWGITPATSGSVVQVETPSRGLEYPLSSGSFCLYVCRGFEGLVGWPRVTGKRQAF